MKLTKSQLKELIKEEIGNIFEEDEKKSADVMNIAKRLDSSGVGDRISSIVNTPREFLEIIDLLLNMIEMNPQMELLGLKKYVMQYQKEMQSPEA